ncbi:MAG TPA: methyltransferase domain-containing protein [Puia sp.]|nr:methyltransferase domain-containing protein [Puia sp.]
MTRIVDTITAKIAAQDPLHGKRLMKNLAVQDDRYHRLAEAFFQKYEAILNREGKHIDYAVDCYLRMVEDVMTETIEFARTGKYTSSTFEEVNKRVYGRPETMQYYMHGLILSQFLWRHHYEMFDYYSTVLPRYTGGVLHYLEVGVGLGFYLSHAREALSSGASLTAVDISETSIALSRKFAGEDRIDYRLHDIFTFEAEQKYDLIVLGEVLEHVEQPLALLLRLKELLADDGVLFFTTPANAPAIDHLYLFHNVEEIRRMVRSAGFSIGSEKALPAEDVSWEKVEQLKVAVLYGAFLTKQSDKHG